MPVPDFIPYSLTVGTVRLPGEEHPRNLALDGEGVPHLSSPAMKDASDEMPGTLASNEAESGVGQAVYHFNSEGWSLTVIVMTVGRRHWIERASVEAR